MPRRIAIVANNVKVSEVSIFPLFCWPICAMCFCSATGRKGWWSYFNLKCLAGAAVIGLLLLIVVFVARTGCHLEVSRSQGLVDLCQPLVLSWHGRCWPLTPHSHFYRLILRFILLAVARLDPVI